MEPAPLPDSRPVTKSGVNRLMNYLIHFLLAGDDDELRLGNLLGDYVKGRVERFEHPGITDRLRTGIQMHRTIDAFSDRHPAVHRSKRSSLRNTGGCPASSSMCSTTTCWRADGPSITRGHCADYTQEVYRTLTSNLHRLPAPVHPLIRSMSRGDWLRGYASQRGIERALQGMAQRRPVAAEIGTAGRLLADHFDRFSADFDEFLPELRVRCAEFLAERDAG